MNHAPHDARLMRLALALGARNLGRTWPNPSVGCVVAGGPVEAPVIVAQGATAPGGRPHAERIALAAAGDAARGATLYVSLEPCSHHGRTPPCVEAIVASGIARVVSALPDPDPRVAGRGHALLREAGIAVATGLGAEDALRLHRGHIARVVKGRPALTLKLARTADGFAAGTGPERLRITGGVANGAVHLMRAHADAIMVGTGTVLADDPDLTCRLPGLAEHSPLRIVIDSRLRTPPSSRLIRSASRVPTLVLAGPAAPPGAEGALAARGAEVVRVEAGPDGRVDLPAALRMLAGRGITRVLAEGGPELAEALAAHDLVDEAVLLTGPAAIGSGRPAAGPRLRAWLAGATLVGERGYGPDRAAFHETGRG